MNSSEFRQEIMGSRVNIQNTPNQRMLKLLGHVLRMFIELLAGFTLFFEADTG